MPVLRVDPLKINLQAQGEGPAARQISVNVERVELVVLVGEIEHAKRNFGFPVQEPVTGKRIPLPKIITGFSGGLANVVLNVPMGVRLGKETTGMIEHREQIHLFENAVQSLRCREIWWNE